MNSKADESFDEAILDNLSFDSASKVVTGKQDFLLKKMVVGFEWKRSVEKFGIYRWRKQ